MSAPPPYSYVAYIDEAGDPGLTKVAPRTLGGSSEWICVAAALVRAEHEKDVSRWVADLVHEMKSHQLRHLHFQKLNDDRKSRACAFIADLDARYFVVVSNKQNMEGWVNPDAAKVPSDNWFYCWLTRLLLERVTEFVYANSLKRFGEPRKVKLESSERGGLRYSQMNAYFEWLKVKSAAGKKSLFLPLGNLRYGVLHPDLMTVHPHTTRDGLKLPDIVASAFFKGVDVHQTHQCDPSYAKLLSPRIAKAPDTGQINGFGVKLFPSWRTLDAFKVPEFQREILRFYGYPKRQWWQQVVEPGPV